MGPSVPKGVLSTSLVGDVIVVSLVLCIVL